MIHKKLRTGVLQHDFKAATPAAIRLKQSRFNLQYRTDIYLPSAEILWRSVNFLFKYICILLLVMA